MSSRSGGLGSDPGAALEISGYRLDQRLLEHPLAEIWRGRSFTGMEVVVLVLSPAGAADSAVRDRLSQASRTTALDPQREETPLWAANLTATRPYAVTQLVPGQSGAERLIDPLDGLLGNDEQALASVRQQLAPYGAAPVPFEHPPAAEQQPTPDRQPAPYGAAPFPGGLFPPADDGQDSVRPSSAPYGAAAVAGRQLPPADDDPAGQPAPPFGAAGEQAASAYGAEPVAAGGQLAGGSAPGAAGEQGSGAQAKPRAGAGHQGKPTPRKWWPYLVAVVVVLAVFSVTYSVGAAIKSANSETDPKVAPPAAVSPAAMPTGVLKPGIEKITSVRWSRSAPFAGVVGAVYPLGADLQVARALDLPFEFGFPRPPVVDEKASVESSTTIYRRVLSGSTAATAGIDLRIALRPCADRAACLADRAAFDKEWSATYKTPAPTTARDSTTWYAVSAQPYTLAMTHVFNSQGRWFLVGTAAVAQPGEEPAAQQVVNDIWRQTS